MKEGAGKGYAPAIYYVGTAWESGRWGQRDRGKALAKWYYAAAMRIGVSLLRGESGLTKIPQGLFMYLSSVLRLFVLVYRNPHDERVLW